MDCVPIRHFSNNSLLYEPHYSTTPLDLFTIQTEITMAQNLDPVPLTVAIKAGYDKC